MNHYHICLIAAASSLPAGPAFMDFILTVTLILGVPLVAVGGWHLSRGMTQEGIMSVTGGFLMCVSVPIIRMIAGWLGTSI